jgi:hypothetical protein
MKNVKSVFTALLAGLFFLGEKSSAQKDEELVTDRPDITESALTVSAQSIQIETGILFQKNLQESNEVRTELKKTALPGILLRYGIFSSIELRAGIVYLMHHAESPRLKENIKGLSDFFWGTKIQLLRDHKQFPDAAIFFHFNLPAGNKEFRPKKVEPEILLACSHNIADPFSISYNFGGKWESTADLINYFYSSSLSINLNEKSGIFTELFGNFSSVSSGTLGLDAGVVYLLFENLQLDISSGFDFDNPADNWFVGTGVSFRLHH